MFDFLKPVTQYCIDHFGVFGMLLASSMPFILLALLGALILGVRFFLKQRGPQKAKRIFKKAEECRAKGDYVQAHTLYLQLHKDYRDQKLATTYQIGLLCKEGVASGWRLREPDSRPEYWFEKSLNPFNPATYYEYGLCLLEASGSDLMHAKGAKQIHQAAKLGHKEARALAEKLDQDAVKALAVADMQAAAGLGHADAQYIVSTKAAGAEQIGWLELAADAEHVKACEVLGTKYVKGEGVKENLSKAVTYLTVAADHGSMNAQAYLGLVYNNKKYPRANEDQSIKWYKLAAAQGHAYAMFNLAVLYANKMDKLAKEKNLTTRLDRISNSTYLAYFEQFQHWKEEAARHGVTVDSVRKA